MSKQPLTPFQQAEIVLEATELGYKHTTIARRHRCSTKTVQRLLRSDPELHPPQSPRPFTSLTENQLELLRKLIRENPYATSTYLANLFYTECHVSIGSRTVRRLRRSLKFTPRRPRFRLKAQEGDEQGKHEFAVQHRDDDMKRWLCEDETTVYLQKTADVAWIEVGKATPPVEIENRFASVRLWGVVGWNWSEFTIKEGKKDQFAYIDWLGSVVAPHLTRRRNYIYLHDHCPWHLPARVQEWFEEHQLEIVVTPKRTPEFNAIEMVWAWMKHFVAKEHPTDQASLEAAVRKAVSTIDQKTIQHYFSHTLHLIQTEADQ